MKNLRPLFILVLGLLAGLSLSVALAWVDPTAAPPAGNAPAPINVSSVTQTKAGSLLVNGQLAPGYGALPASGERVGALFTSSTDDALHRWSGTQWQRIQDFAWYVEGENVYTGVAPALTGNVGIGTNSPTYAKLTVVGGIIAGTFNAPISAKKIFVLAGPFGGATLGGGSLDGSDTFYMASHDYAAYIQNGMRIDGAVHINSGGLSIGGESEPFLTGNYLTVSGNVLIGIESGVSVPSFPGLEIINGGVRLATIVARPACVSARRGAFWVIQGGFGVKDEVAVCAKAADGTYAWRILY